MRIKALLFALLFLPACKIMWWQAGPEPALPVETALEPPAAEQHHCRRHLRDLNRRWTERDYMCRPDERQGQ